jgi:S1-C subfamily serine protease
MGVVTEIAATGSVERGWLGIAGRGLTPGLAERFGLRAPHGVLITSVLEDSPAADAGLRSGDVVTRAAGEPLHSAHELLETVTNAGPAARIALEIRRGSEQREVLLTTAKRPPGGMLGRVGD